ncbi:hypothetical protein ACWEGE_32975 [Amycolatopsis sp. NPDC004747]
MTTRQFEEAERIALTITHAPVRAEAFAATTVEHDHAATARRLTAEALLADWTNAIPAPKTSPRQKCSSPITRPVIERQTVNGLIVHC